jgi:hypothetical protein
MPKYRLLAAAVIDGAVREAGEEIEFEGTPGHHMEPLDKAAERAVKEMPGPAPLDPEYLAYVSERGIPGQIMTGFAGFPAGDVPVNVDVPYVSGIGAVGETLTCTMGNWTGEPYGYAYKWKHKNVATPIAEGSSTYVVKQGDAGKDVFCTVAATNDWGSTEAPPSNAIAISATSSRSGGSRG